MKPFKEAIAIYQAEVQKYKDLNKDNFWKKHSLPFTKSGIERATEFLTEIAQAKTVEQLLKIAGDKKYDTGDDLIAIIVACTLDICESTKHQIDEAAKKYAHRAYFATGGRGSRSAASYHPAETKDDPGPQANAKKDIFKKLVAMQDEELAPVDKGQNVKELVLN